MPLTSVSVSTPTPYVAHPPPEYTENIQLHQQIEQLRTTITERDREIVQLRDQMDKKEKKIKELEEINKTMVIRDPNLELAVLKLKRIQKILSE